MPLSDLDSILNKDAIIATYPAAHLRSIPEQVEHMYRAHAKTHIPLGDTSKYVDTIFKWVGGQNKGGFIGAVVGDYGHGKTSFQVHVWEESTERKVFSVPPFSWKRVADMIEGTAAWIDYMIAKSNPDQALKAKKIYDKYREQTLIEAAKKVAQETGQKIDDVHTSLSALAGSGVSVGMEITVDRFLDYCEEVTTVVKEAGYVGLLMLLDEPEVAAKELGFANVSLILFEIANGLLQRQGDYGVFVSMPENFLAIAQRTHAALPARLQARNCMSRLRDIYGSDFAEQLWASYVRNFNLGSEGEKIVAPITLKAIGQVASSDRKDLSYGPRTVVSTFRQMVHRYKGSQNTYEIEDFVEDCLEDEILVSPDYPSRIRECLNRPEASRLNRRSIKILSGFPNGVTTEQLKKLGIDAAFIEQARSSGVVYKQFGLLGLSSLRKIEGDVSEREPDHTITEIFNEFAPAPKSFKTAKEAFVNYLIPLIFEKKSGQQLVGWDLPDKWLERNSGVIFAEIVGAFNQSSRDYPRRRVAIAVGPVNEIIQPKEFRDRETSTDILIHFLMRWNVEESLPQQLVQVLPGRPEKSEPAVIRIAIDLAGDPIQSEQLQNIVDTSFLTPLGILYLIGEMDRQNFPQEVAAVWDAIRKPLLRNLPARFFQDEEMRSQATEEIKRTIPSGAFELVPSLCDHVLRERYPEYSTLIRQPQWTNRVGDYILALQNQNIPLSCKRGRETWKASKRIVADAFNTNIMNLNDFFSGYENLIYINMGRGREDDAEVEFKMHPLEVRIMERIIGEKPPSPLKIDGKECWWVNFNELMPLLLYTGYQYEEILEIVKIGKARGTFSTTEHRGGPVLYCMPLDPEQMKAQLREKLESLKEEFEELKKLPKFRHDFNFDSVEKKIVNLADDADFESIKSNIHRAFEQNHDRLDSYFSQLEEALKAEMSNAVQVEQNLSSSRQVSGLKTPPAASSKWCADLNTYIVANLGKTVEDIKRECSSLKQKASRSISEFTESRKGSPIEKIKRLNDGWNSHASLSAQVQNLKNDFQQLQKHLDDYDQWVRLLTPSDDLHKLLIEMKKDDAHKLKANELIKETEVVWEGMSDHLRTRNVNGLGSYKQYFKQLEDIETKRRKYLQELRGAFEKVKDRVNLFLTDIGGADSRVNVVFNPDDSKGCYAQLFNQAVEQLKKVCEDESMGLSEKKLDILYAGNVLKRVTLEEVAQVLTELKKCEEILENLSKNLTTDWIEEIVKEDVEPKASIDEVKEAISKTREASRDARKMIIEKNKQKGGAEISKESKEMLKLIPDNQAVDLKQLILQMLKEDQPPAGILESALKHLSELFMNDKVQIKLELPRSR
ncbi:MAG: hypothetical protein C4549_06710 [Deltaproteobacteria bacterium]|jgi:hypothetical protein|nr:MAG: hypothetical protein C4549_06710 [Deltaproteobacteria bacterium]